MTPSPGHLRRHVRGDLAEQEQGEPNMLRVAVSSRGLGLVALWAMSFATALAKDPSPIGASKRVKPTRLSNNSWRTCARRCDWRMRPNLNKGSLLVQQN